MTSLQACNSYAQKETYKAAKDIKQEIEKMMAEEEMQPASFSFYATYVESDTALFSYRHKKSIIPASTMKVVTTSTALSILGKDYRFKTLLQHDGQIDKEGKLTGNIYLKGGGDPSLGIDDLDKLINYWVKAIKKKGIKSIDGTVIGDASIFDDWQVPSTWVYEDMGNYYGAGASGLTIHENMYKVYFSSGKQGSQTKMLKTDPEMSDITFINEIKAGANNSGDDAYIFGSPYTYIRYMTGTISGNRSNFAVKGAIPDPSLFAARYLKSALEKAGIKSSQKASSVRLLTIEKQLSKQKRINFDTLYSKTLDKIVEKTNFKSKNLYAELLLKILGYEKLGKGTSEAGQKVITEFWEKQGLDMNGFFIEDGSGLSRYTSITSEQLCLILKFMTKQKNYQSLYNSLPIAGVSGTMKRFGKGTNIQNNMRAKSGYLSRVKSYAGYVKSKSGKNIAFTMLVNHYAGSNGDMNKRIGKLMVLLGELE
jgi:D-alanyl-D-alanine carboxypeptidase/D-alanyl-D-alanine-endopeptidase (penicillin-binding protein 4)